MTTRTFRVQLTSDPVQPVTVPNNATLLKAVRWPDKNVEMFYLADEDAGWTDIVIEQVMDEGVVKEASIRHLTSVDGIWDSRFCVTHLFEVFP